MDFIERVIKMFGNVSVLKEERVKARKEHYCDTCGSIILPKEMYNRQTNTMDNEIYTWKNCDHCKKIREEAWQYYYETWGITSLTSEDFYEYIKEANIDFIERRKQDDK